MSTPKLSGERSHCCNAPNNQLPVDPGRADLGNCPAMPFVSSHVGDSVLMYSEQLRFPLRAPTAAANTRDTSGICVLEGVESRAIQPPWSARTGPGGGESGFWSRCVVETSDKPPSAFVSGEDERLAIVTSCDDGILGCPYEGNEGEGRHPDRMDRGTRTRVNDGNCAVMALESMFNISSA